MSVKIGKIAQSYIDSGANNRDVSRSRGSKPSETKPPTTQHQDPRFTNPAFRKAVRTVLTYLGLEPTFRNFQKHDAKYKSTFPIAWREFARNIGNSSTRDIEDHAPGVYLVTSVGKEIELGKCLESINKLTEFNRR